MHSIDRPRPGRGEETPTRWTDAWTIGVLLAGLVALTLPAAPATAQMAEDPEWTFPLTFQAFALSQSAGGDMAGRYPDASGWGVQGAFGWADWLAVGVGIDRTSADCVHERCAEGTTAGSRGKYVFIRLRRKLTTRIRPWASFGVRAGVLDQDGQDIQGRSVTWESRGTISPLLQAGVDFVPLDKFAVSPFVRYHRSKFKIRQYAVTPFESRAAEYTSLEVGVGVALDPRLRLR